MSPGAVPTRPMHRCPGPRCTVLVPFEMLMCGRHWRSVPRTLQNRVLTAWDGGRGFGTDAHIAAREAAVRAIGGDE
jgi:hypothetical protein